MVRNEFWYTEDGRGTRRPRCPRCYDNRIELQLNDTLRCTNCGATEYGQTWRDMIGWLVIAATVLATVLIWSYIGWQVWWMLPDLVQTLFTVVGAVLLGLFVISVLVTVTGGVNDGY